LLFYYFNLTSEEKKRGKPFPHFSFLAAASKNEKGKKKGEGLHYERLASCHGGRKRGSPITEARAFSGVSCRLPRRRGGKGGGRFPGRREKEKKKKQKSSRRLATSSMKSGTPPRGREKEGRARPCATASSPREIRRGGGGKKKKKKKTVGVMSITSPPSITHQRADEIGEGRKEKGGSPYLCSSHFHSLMPLRPDADGEERREEYLHQYR